MKGLGKASAATVVVIDEAHAAQRIDNFLLGALKGVPRSRVYRLLRGGEVRVNSRRVEATYRLQTDDRVRIPPVRTSDAPARKPVPRGVAFPVAYEDEALLVIDKPAGLAVHGGSGVSFGLIEQIRAARPELRFLELAHRLDRETSGLLALAKKRSALVGLHAALREGRVTKVYLALVKGAWARQQRDVELPLRKYVTRTGERRVSVEEGGQASRTRFALVERYGDYSLLQATLATGRTHQIRVQLAHLGFPIVGDDKYGDFELNRELAKRGLKRMFLHAQRLAFAHPSTGQRIDLESPLAIDLANFLAQSRHAETV